MAQCMPWPLGRYRWISGLNTCGFKATKIHLKSVSYVYLSRFMRRTDTKGLQAGRPFVRPADSVDINHSLTSGGAGPLVVFLPASILTTAAMASSVSYRCDHARVSASRYPDAVLYNNTIQTRITHAHRSKASIFGCRPRVAQNAAPKVRAQASDQRFPQPESYKIWPTEM